MANDFAKWTPFLFYRSHVAKWNSDGSSDDNGDDNVFLIARFLMVVYGDHRGHWLPLSAAHIEYYQYKICDSGRYFSRISAVAHGIRYDHNWTFRIDGRFCLYIYIRYVHTRNSNRALVTLLDMQVKQPSDPHICESNESSKLRKPARFNVQTEDTARNIWKLWLSSYQLVSANRIHYQVYRFFVWSYVGVRRSCTIRRKMRRMREITFFYSHIYVYVI